MSGHNVVVPSSFLSVLVVNGRFCHIWFLPNTHTHTKKASLLNMHLLASSIFIGAAYIELSSQSPVPVLSILGESSTLQNASQITSLLNYQDTLSIRPLQNDMSSFNNVQKQHPCEVITTPDIQYTRIVSKPTLTTVAAPLYFTTNLPESTTTKVQIGKRGIIHLSTTKTTVSTVSQSVNDGVIPRPWWSVTGTDTEAAEVIPTVATFLLSEGPGMSPIWTVVTRATLTPSIMPNSIYRPAPWWSPWGSPYYRGWRRSDSSVSNELASEAEGSKLHIRSEDNVDGHDGKQGGGNEDGAGQVI